jgi:hypothetical protein
MNTDNLSKWLTLAANFGVVVGIFVLVFELQQNQAMLEQEHKMNLLTARVADIQQYQEFRWMLVQDKELMQLWMDGLDGKELTEVQDMRFLFTCISALWADASTFERSIALGRNDTTAVTIANDLRRNIEELPGYKRCWDATEQAIVDYGFGEFVDAVKKPK